MAEGKIRRPCQNALGAIGVPAKRWTTRVDLNELLVMAKDQCERPPWDDKSLSDLACSVGLSPYHFHRLFSARFGKTPVEVAREARFRFSKQLLSSSELCIQEIALECGYDSHSAFSRAFHRVTGQSPSQYRNSFKQEL